MISFKDYAKQNGISYEAVRAQVKRFSAELDVRTVPSRACCSWQAFPMWAPISLPPLWLWIRP